MKKKLLCISVLFAASFTAHADRLDEIQEAGIIRVGTTGDYKPFSSFDGKQFSGYDIDVAKYIAEQLDVKLELVQTSFPILMLTNTTSLWVVSHVKYNVSCMLNKAKAT